MLLIKAKKLLLLDYISKVTKYYYQKFQDNDGEKRNKRYPK